MMNTHPKDSAAHEIARELVANIGRAAAATNNYPDAWRLWKSWADNLVQPWYWATPLGAEFLRQTKRNLQNMTAIYQIKP